MISAVIAVGGVMPFSARAATITPPNNTVAISEATYFAIKGAHCYYENAPSHAVVVSGNMKCDPVLAQYNGKTVMRVQKAGEMYTVTTADGFGPLLKTYTQGIYQVNGAYYYVNNGMYKKLGTSRPDKTIFAMARAKHSGVKMITRAQFDMFYGKGGTAAEVATAKKIQQAYKGYFVIISDDHGKLFYVPTNIEDGEKPVRINGAFHDSIKEAANVMSKKALSSMIKE